jgi:hypothetical protein
MTVTLSERELADQLDQPALPSPDHSAPENGRGGGFVEAGLYGVRKRDPAVLAESLSAEGVTRCTSCPWTFRGSLVDGVAAHKLHRAAEHPSLASESTPRGRRGGAAAAMKRRQMMNERDAKLRIIHEALQEGPKTAAQLGELVDMPAGRCSVFLDWARRKNDLNLTHVANGGKWTLLPEEAE